MAFFLISFSLFSHRGTLKGTLNDSISSQSIPGAIISIRENNLVTSTDLFGNFTFTDIHPGKYQLRVSMFGYEPKLISVEIKEDQAVSLRINLNRALIDLSEVIIANIK